MADQSEQQQQQMQMQMQSLFSLMQLFGGEMERGPRYRAYAHLRESRLRLKNEMNTPSPKAANIKKQEAVRFSPPEVAISVPDFSVTLRKENRKPPDHMMKKNNNNNNNNTTSPLFHRGRSKSASPSDKKMAVRKSFTAFNHLNSIPIQHQQHNNTLATARPPKTNTFLPNYRL